MNRITELRKKHGISQKKLGSIIGVAQNTVCNWEKENRQPDYNAVRKMAALFNVSIDYLLGVSPEEKKPPTEIMRFRNDGFKKCSRDSRYGLLQKI